MIQVTLLLHRAEKVQLKLERCHAQVLLLLPVDEDAEVADQLASQGCQVSEGLFVLHRVLYLVQHGDIIDAHDPKLSIHSAV